MPTKIENRIAAMITRKAVCAPQMTREYTSKPLTVVPQMLMGFGGCCEPNDLPSTPRWANPYGAIHCANAATMRNTTVSDESEDEHEALQSDALTQVRDDGDAIEERLLPRRDAGRRCRRDLGLDGRGGRFGRHVSTSPSGR